MIESVIFFDKSILFNLSNKKLKKPVKKIIQNLFLHNFCASSQLRFKIKVFNGQSLRKNMI